VPRVIEGQYGDPGGRFAIVAGRFNEFITKQLVDGCVETLRRNGVDTDSRVDLVWVPGAFEIPLTCQLLAESGRYSSVISLGAVIRGSTSHYDYVCSQVTSGVGAVSLKTGIPVIFGMLTTDTIEAAIERAGTKAGNNGSKAALAAIEMVSLVQKLES
jgi:6,7-dimethyl-8-ribityllumazine synthase